MAAGDPLALLAAAQREFARRVTAVDGRDGGTDRRIAQFALSLRRKRRAALLRLLPRTVRALGPEFADLFAAYVATAPAHGHDYVRDAVQFCIFVRRTAARREAGEVAGAEAAGLEVAAGRARFRCRLLRRTGLTLLVHFRLTSGGPPRCWAIRLRRARQGA